MTHLTRVLATTDFSPAARDAARRAAALLAGRADATLLLLHAVSSSALQELRVWLGDEALETRLLEQAGERLHAQAQALTQEHGVSVQEVLTTGRVIDEVLDHAQTHDVELIVAGTRGESALHRLTVGSTAERIAQRTRRPALLVRQAPQTPYRRALVAVDFSDWSAASVRLARQVAPQAELLLTHAVAAPFQSYLHDAGVGDAVIQRQRQAARAEAAVRLKTLMAQPGCDGAPFRVLTPDADPAWLQIVRLAQEHLCDLIVMGKHGRHAVEELLVGSATRMVIAESACDVLVSTGRDG